MRPLDRRRGVDLLGQADPLAAERAGLAAPRAMGDLECVLEELEAVGPGPVFDAERLVLALVPGGAEAEVGSAAGQDVERPRLFHEDRRVAVRDAGHECPELHSRRGRGQVRQREPTFQDRVIPPAELHEMVPDPDRIEPGCLGPPADSREMLAHPGVAAGPFEVVDLETELHRFAYLHDRVLFGGIRRHASARP
jgi:hypothetical protein